MKFKVLTFCVFTLFTDLVASIPFYEDQRINQFGEYQNPGASHTGNAPEQWSANLARSQNANLMSGSTFEGQLPGYQNPTTNNFGIPLSNNRPLNIPQQNYNQFPNNIRVQNEDGIAQAPAILGDLSYSRPVSEPFVNPTSVERQNYFTGPQSNVPQNYHALQTGVTSNIEQLSLQSVPQTYPSGSLAQNTRIFENAQNIREPYQSATPIRHENYNNFENPHVAEAMIPIRNEHLQAIQEPYQNTGSIKQIYNDEKLHIIPEQIENIRPATPIQYEDVHVIENPIKETYHTAVPIQNHRNIENIRLPLESYSLPTQSTHQNIPQVQQFKVPEEPIYPVQPTNDGYYAEHNINHPNIFNPTIREVLQTTPNKKRYMVIHSDGSVQHTDLLSPALVNNPNYVMLAGGKIVPKEILPVNSGSPTIPSDLKKPVILENKQPPGNNQLPLASANNGPPVKSGNNYPSNPSATADSSDSQDNSIPSTSPNPLAPTTPISTKTPEAITTTTTTASPIKATTSSTLTTNVVPELNATNLTNSNSSLLPMLAKLFKSSKANTTVSNSTQNQSTTTTTTKPNKKYNPIDIILNDKPNSPQNHTAVDQKNNTQSDNPNNTKATTPTPPNHPETTTKINLLTSLGNSSTTTPQPNTNKTATTPSHNKNNQENNTTSQPKDTETTTTPKPNDNIEKSTNTSSPKTTTANNSTNPTTPEEEDPEEELPEDEKDPKINNTPIKKDNKGALNGKTTTPSPVKTSTLEPDSDEYEEDEEKLEEVEEEEEQLKEAFVKKWGKHLFVHIGKHCGVVSKEFIRKLYYANNEPDTLYVFHVQNQPLVEKDVKRTIFPNGTIVEEITEFTNEDNNPDDIDDEEYYEPIIKKSVNIIIPEKK